MVVVVRFLIGRRGETLLRLVGLGVERNDFGVGLRIGGGRMFVKFLLGVFILLLSVGIKFEIFPSV